VSDCRRTADRLAPYVDRVLPASERADVEQHLARCQPCRGAAHAEEGARAVLREKAAGLQAQPLPPGLRGRCEALASEHLKRTPGRTWRLIPVSITAVLTIFIATVVFSLATQQSNTLLAAQLTVDHSKCFSLFGEVEGPLPTSVDLEKMLLDDYGWAVRVPPSSAVDGVQLIGARRCLYADGRIPHVMYRVNGQDVSLFLLAGVTRNDANVVSLGHRSQIWSRDGTTYVLVAPNAAGDLANAARYLMREAH
jgi:anti-sigma factor RsiW